VVTHHASLEPFLGRPFGPYNAAAAEAMQETFGKEPGFTREGGSIGAVLTMRRLLRAPIVFMGLSLPEHGYHAINENYDWGQARGGMEMFCRYFHKIAEMGPKPPGGGGGRGKG
jgi:acetylornithine deacetylase/succinyl-diaminopimelate desuccinylase-like protein